MQSRPESKNSGLPSRSIKTLALPNNFLLPTDLIRICYIKNYGSNAKKTCRFPGVDFVFGNHDLKQFYFLFFFVSFVKLNKNPKVECFVDFCF